MHIGGFTDQNPDVTEEIAESEIQLPTGLVNA